ncbi:LuxR C-terminal-related transcriptional regulator [Nocardia sp. NPDC001965]
MDGSLFSPVVQLRNAFEYLPGFLRAPIEMVVFGGELPGADISGMRRMAAELRARSLELEGHSADIDSLLTQEDSVGETAEQLREALSSYRQGAAQLGKDVNALADQGQAAANDAEKWLCVMFTFGIHLAWKIYGLLAAAAAAGPAGQVSAAPAVESTLVQGRAEVAVMRANLQRAIQAGGAEAAAQLSGMGSAQFAKWMGTAVALPVGVEVGVQALQVATGDRALEIIGEDGSDPTGIDLKSIEVAAVSAAGGAAGARLAGRFAPMAFPQIATSRVAMGLVHGTAGALSGLGAAALVAGWPQHYTEVLGPLLNGAVAGGVYAQSAGPSAIDGGAPFTPPDPISAGHDANTAAPRPPIEISAESKRAWEVARQTWNPAAETANTAGERSGPLAEVVGEAAAAQPQARSGQQASASADGAGGGTPTATGGRAPEGAAGRAPEGTGGRAPGSQAAAGASSDAAPARPRSEATATVERPPADTQGAAGRAPAPRSVEAAGDTAPPPKVPTDVRPVGEVPEKAGAPDGAHAAVADGAGNEASARPHPVAEGDAGSPGARAEQGASGGEEHVTAQRDATPEQSGQERPESSDRTEADGTDTSAAGDRSASVHDEQNVAATDHDSLAEAAGLPRSDRDRAVDLLIDFHQASAEHVPESQRLSNLPDDVLKAGLHGGDEHQSLLATVELIRRGTVSDAVPGGMVLRVEQAEAVYAMKSRPVEMKPGEGKSLAFMATAIQRAVHHGSVLLVTTTDGLANREVVTYEKLLTDSTNQKLMADFGIDVFRADQENGFGPIAEGRPAIVVATGETVGHLCNAGIEPPRHVLIDEMDGIIDRGERQFLRSEGAEQAAPEATARQVFDAHDFLAESLADGALSHEDFGLRRIAEEIGVQADGTPEFVYWYDGQPELTPAGRAKVEALPDGRNWLEGMGASRLETAANAEFLVRSGVHYEMDAGKIVIIDQAEHGLQRNPKTSSESRWSAEPGKASLAQAIEAKEFRAAEARGEKAENHQIVVRADAESAKRIDSVEIYRVGEGSFFDEVTGASGTLTDLNPVLQKIYGLEPAYEVGRSQTHRLVEGQHDVAENTHAKLRTIAEYANELRDGGAGRFQEILCHRNDLVERQVEALVRAGVPREAIEAVDAKRIVGWGADWEVQLQKVFDEAGEQGKILVINRQGQRGVDISVSDAVKAMGGMHAWMTEAPEQSYIHEQAKNRTARNGQLGSAQVVMSPEDALIRNAMHLRGVRETVVHYEQAVAAHAADPTPRTHDAMVEARQSVRELVPELQQRALRHSTADFVRHHAFSTIMPALTLAEAETGQYGGDVDFTRPDGPADRTARLAGLLGVPAPEVADQITALERSGSLDPIRELLQRTGITPAAAEALRQHVEATAPASTLQRALFTDEQALDHMMPLRDRLAAELGLPIAAVDGAEGMRTLDPELTEARAALAAALGYPVASINPGIARDILGESVGDHLPAVNIAESDARDDTDSLAAESGPVGHGTRHETSQDAVAQQSDTQNSDADEATADDIVAAASRYLALSALLDSVVQIHRRSPNSCVNNAVTGMRVLCPDNAGRFWTPPTSLDGYGRETVRDIFGAGLEETGSLDEVVESLKYRPGGISVLVYKWKDTRANGTSTEADDHMVLLVNDSTSIDEPNLVVVDLAASRDRNTDNDYGPRDLRNRRTLLNKAVGFDDWRREQEVFINRIPAGERRFETIEFDRDGNLVSGSPAEAPDAERLPPSRRVDVPSIQDQINAIPVGQQGPDEAVLGRWGSAGDISNDRRRDEFRLVGSRPHDGPDHITDNPGPTPASARPTASTTPGSAAAASGNPAQPNTPAANNAPPDDGTNAPVRGRPSDRDSGETRRVRRGETISDDQNYEWRQLRGRYELALARYLYNSPITRRAIVETLRLLRDVLTGLHPEASSEQIDEAFFAPEIDRWDGIVPRSVPLEELLRDGNPRELMAALLNAMLRGGERKPPCSTTLDAGLIKLFRQPEWETAAADLGLDVPALRGVRASMLENTPLADLTVKDLHLVRHATLRTDAALRVFDEYDRRSRADVRPRTDENRRRRLLTVQDWALMGMPLSHRELEAVPGGLRAFRINRLDPDRILRDDTGRVDVDALEAQLKSEDSTVENVLPLYVHDERGRRVRDDSGKAVIRTVLVYHDHGIVDAATALRLDPRRYAVRIPWRPGGARFDFDPNGAWFREKAIEHGIPALTGISGTTARMMARFAWLRPPGVVERDFAGAVMAALYPHHTDYEIVQAMRMAGVSIVDESILDATDFNVTAFYRAVFSAFGYDISHVDSEEAVFYEEFFDMFGAEDELDDGRTSGEAAAVAEAAARGIDLAGAPEGAIGSKPHRPNSLPPQSLSSDAAATARPQVAESDSPSLWAEKGQRTGGSPAPVLPAEVRTCLPWVVDILQRNGLPVLPVTGRRAVHFQTATGSGLQHQPITPRVRSDDPMWKAVDDLRTKPVGTYAVAVVGRGEHAHAYIITRRTNPGTGLTTTYVHDQLTGGDPRPYLDWKATYTEPEHTYIAYFEPTGSGALEARTTPDRSQLAPSFEGIDITGAPGRNTDGRSLLRGIVWADDAAFAAVAGSDDAIGARPGEGERAGGLPAPILRNVLQRARDNDNAAFEQLRGEYGHALFAKVLADLGVPATAVTSELRPLVRVAQGLNRLAFDIADQYRWRVQDASPLEWLHGIASNLVTCWFEMNATQRRHAAEGLAAAQRGGRLTAVQRGALDRLLEAGRHDAQTPDHRPAGTPWSGKKVTQADTPASDPTAADLDDASAATENRSAENEAGADAVSQPRGEQPGSEADRSATNKKLAFWKWIRGRSGWSGKREEANTETTSPAETDTQTPSETTDSEEKGKEKSILHQARTDHDLGRLLAGNIISATAGTAAYSATFYLAQGHGATAASLVEVSATLPSILWSQLAGDIVDKPGTDLRRVLRGTEAAMVATSIAGLGALAYLGLDAQPLIPILVGTSFVGGSFGILYSTAFGKAMRIKTGDERALSYQAYREVEWRVIRVAGQGVGPALFLIAPVIPLAFNAIGSVLNMGALTISRKIKGRDATDSKQNTPQKADASHRFRDRAKEANIALHNNPMLEYIVRSGNAQNFFLGAHYLSYGKLVYDAHTEGLVTGGQTSVLMVAAAMGGVFGALIGAEKHLKEKIERIRAKDDTKLVRVLLMARTAAVAGLLVGDTAIAHPWAAAAANVAGWTVLGSTAAPVNAHRQTATALAMDGRTNALLNMRTSIAYAAGGLLAGQTLSGLGAVPSAWWTAAAAVATGIALPLAGPILGALRRLPPDIAATLAAMAARPAVDWWLSAAPAAWWTAAAAAGAVVIPPTLGPILGALRRLPRTIAATLTAMTGTPLIQGALKLFRPGQLPGAAGTLDTDRQPEGPEPTTPGDAQTEDHNAPTPPDNTSPRSHNPHAPMGEQDLLSTSEVSAPGAQSASVSGHEERMQGAVPVGGEREPGRGARRMIALSGGEVVPLAVDIDGRGVDDWRGLKHQMRKQFRDLGIAHIDGGGAHRAGGNGTTPWRWRRKPPGEGEQTEPAQDTETAGSAPWSTSRERPGEGEGEARTASLPDQSTGLPRSDSIGARPPSEEPGSGSNDREVQRGRNPAEERPAPARPDPFGRIGPILPALGFDDGVPHQPERTVPLAGAQFAADIAQRQLREERAEPATTGQSADTPYRLRDLDATDQPSARLADARREHTAALLRYGYWDTRTVDLSGWRDHDIAENDSFWLSYRQADTGERARQREAARQYRDARDRLAEADRDLTRLVEAAGIDPRQAALGRHASLVGALQTVADLVGADWVRRPDHPDFGDAPDDLADSVRARVLRYPGQTYLVWELRRLGPGAVALVSDTYHGGAEQYVLSNIDGTIMEIERSTGVLREFTPEDDFRSTVEGAFFGPDKRPVHPVGGAWDRIALFEPGAARRRGAEVVRLHTATAAQQQDGLSELAARRSSVMLKQYVTTAEYRKLAARLGLDPDTLSRQQLDQMAQTPSPPVEPESRFYLPAPAPLAERLPELVRIVAELDRLARQVRELDEQIAAGLAGRPQSEPGPADRARFHGPAVVALAMALTRNPDIRPLGEDSGDHGAPEFAVAAALGSEPRTFTGGIEQISRVVQALGDGAAVVLSGAAGEIGALANIRDRIVAVGRDGVVLKEMQLDIPGDISEVAGFVFSGVETAVHPMAADTRAQLTELAAQYATASRAGDPETAERVRQAADVWCYGPGRSEPVQYGTGYRRTDRSPFGNLDITVLPEPLGRLWEQLRTVEIDGRREMSFDTDGMSWSQIDDLREQLRALDPALARAGWSGWGLAALAELDRDAGNAAVVRADLELARQSVQWTEQGWVQVTARPVAAEEAETADITDRIGRLERERDELMKRHGLTPGGARTEPGSAPGSPEMLERFTRRQEFIDGQLDRLAVRAGTGLTRLDQVTLPEAEERKRLELRRHQVELARLAQILRQLRVLRHEPDPVEPMPMPPQPALGDNGPAVADFGLLQERIRLLLGQVGEASDDARVAPDSATRRDARREVDEQWRALAAALEIDPAQLADLSPTVLDDPARLPAADPIRLRVERLGPADRQRAAAVRKRAEAIVRLDAVVAELDEARQVLDDEATRRHHEHRYRKHEAGTWLTDHAKLVPTAERGRKPTLLIVAMQGRHDRARRELIAQHAEFAGALARSSPYNVAYITVSPYADGEVDFRFESKEYRPSNTEIGARLMTAYAEGLLAGRPAGPIGFDAWMESLGGFSSSTTLDELEARIDITEDVDGTSARAAVIRMLTEEHHPRAQWRDTPPDIPVATTSHEIVVGGVVIQIQMRENHAANMWNRFELAHDHRAAETGKAVAWMFAGGLRARSKEALARKVAGALRNGRIDPAFTRAGPQVRPTGRIGSRPSPGPSDRGSAAAAGPLALLSAARAGDETAREQLWRRFYRGIAVLVAGAMPDRPDQRKLAEQTLREVFDLAFDPNGPAAPVRDVELWLRAIARDVVDRMVFRHVCAGVAAVLARRGMESSPAYRLLVEPIPADAARQAMAALADTRYNRWLRQNFWAGGGPADGADLPQFDHAAVPQLLRVVAEALGKDVPALPEELGEISERADEGSDSDAAPPSPALLRVALLRDPYLVIPHLTSLSGPEALYGELHFGYGWPIGKVAASTGDAESAVHDGLERIAQLSVGKLPSVTVASYQDARPDHAFTIENLAREAGTSPAEVDDALNGSPGAGPEIRQRVLAAADRLRYHRELLCAYMFHDRQAAWGLDGRVLAAATTSELASAFGRLGLLEQRVIQSRFEELRSVAETAALSGMAESVVRELERTAVRGLVEALTAVVDPAVAREFGAPAVGVRFAAFEAVVRLRRLVRDYPGVLQPSEFAEAEQAPYSAVGLINRVHGMVSKEDDSVGAASRALALLRVALRDPDPAVPRSPDLSGPEALYAELHFGYGWPIRRIATSTGVDQKSVYDRLAHFAQLSVAKLPPEIVARHWAAGAHRTPTTADLAAEVDTSPAGISRALNGSPGVGPEMRQKVFAAADRLGYQRSDFVLLRRELLCAFMFHDRQATWGLDGRVLAAATNNELNGAIGRLGEAEQRVIQSRFEELRSVAETAALSGMAESVVRELERTAVRGLVEALTAVVDPAVAREFGAPAVGVRFAAFEAVVRLRRLVRDYPGVLQPSEFAEAEQAPYSAVGLISRVLGSDTVAREGQPPAAPAPARDGSAAGPSRGGGAAAALPPEYLSFDDPGGDGLGGTRARRRDRSGRWRPGGLDPSVLYVDTPGESAASGVRKRGTGGRTGDGGRSATATGSDSDRIGAKPAASPDDGAPHDRRPSEDRTHIVKNHVAQGNPEPALDMLRTWLGEKLYRWLSRRYGASPLARDIVDDAIERALDTLHRMPDDLDIEQWIVAKVLERMPHYDMFVEFRRRLVHVATSVNDSAPADDPATDGAQLAQILEQATAAQIQHALRSDRLNDTQRALLNTVRTMPRSPSAETTGTGNRPFRQMELLAATRVLARQLAVDKEMPSTILRMLADGHTVSGIAADSKRALNRLKTRCADLADEFGAANESAALVATGIRRGLIDKPEQSPLALFPGERAVLTAKAYGMTDRQAADETGRSLEFVQATVELLQRRTQSRTTAQLVARTIDQLDFVAVDSRIYKLLSGSTDERISQELGTTAPALRKYYSELVRRLNINYNRALAQVAAERMESNATVATEVAKPRLSRGLLNDREAELLALYKQGKTPEQCAEIMGLSVKTINNYTREIGDRLGFGNRDAILRRGIQLGIVKEPAEITVGPRLSGREAQIVAARAQGMTYAETAEQLDISVDSVSVAVRHIFYKTSADNWREVFEFAVAEGIIQEAPEEELWRNILLLLAAGHTVPSAAAAMDRSHDWLLARLPALATRLRTVVDDTVTMWTESHSTAMVADGIRRGLIDAPPQFPILPAPVDRAILAAKSQGRTTAQAGAVVNLSPSQTRLRLARLRDATNCATTAQLVAKTIHQLDADTIATRHTELIRILAMIATGHGRQDIAKEFGRSLAWVNLRFTALAQTFGVPDHQAALAAAAIRARILAPTPIATELSLDEQERRIILLKAEGKSDRVIAIELQVPSKVVRTAVVRLRKATGSGTVAHLIAKTIDAVDADSTPSADVPDTSTDEIVRGGAETDNGRIERFLTATVSAMNRRTRQHATRTDGAAAETGAARDTGRIGSKPTERPVSDTDVETPPDNGAASTASEPRIPARPTPWSGAAQRRSDDRDRAVGREDRPPPEMPTAR